MMYTRNLKTMEVIAEIIENSVDNIDFCKGWTESEISDYLSSNYPCSNYCARQAARYLSAGIIPDKAINIKHSKKTYLKS